MNQSSGNDSPVYEKPHALRLGDGRAGEGVGTCTGPGSSDSWCQIGNSATVYCYANGSAASACSGNGNEQVLSSWRD